MRGSKPEIALRRALHDRGLRFYVSQRKAIGRPELGIPSDRLAVFVDGDLWRGHPSRRTPAAWRQQSDGNRQGNAVVNSALRDVGWTVLRFWEHEIDRDLEACVSQGMRAAGR